MNAQKHKLRTHISDYSVEIHIDSNDCYSFGGYLKRSSEENLDNKMTVLSLWTYHEKPGPTEVLL
jgi:hypothetical protein